MKNTKKGFTLIELLVVVAIIGILATVVLASLGSARQKAKISAAKAAMSQLRAEMELVALDAGTYVGAGSEESEVTGSNCLKSGADKFLKEADKQLGTTTATCKATPSAYAAEVVLDSKTSEKFCVDSNGFAGKGSITDNACVAA